MNLAPVDWAIIIATFALVLGLGSLRATHRVGGFLKATCGVGQRLRALLASQPLKATPEGLPGLFTSNSLVRGVMSGSTRSAVMRKSGYVSQ